MKKALSEWECNSLHRCFKKSLNDGRNFWRDIVTQFAGFVAVKE
jgi:hypothetical protein